MLPFSTSLNGRKQKYSLSFLMLRFLNDRKKKQASQPEKKVCPIIFIIVDKITIEFNFLSNDVKSVIMFITNYESG